MSYLPPPRSVIELRCDGDVTGSLLGAMAALEASGGGTIRMSAGSGYCTAQLVKTGFTPIRIRGAGGKFLGEVGGTVLDLRYAAGPKIHCPTLDYRVSTMEIDHLTLIDTTDGTQNFLMTESCAMNFHDNTVIGKNSTLNGVVPVQDGFVFGGPNGPGPGADYYRGYGTVVHNNAFLNIRRAAYVHGYGNSATITLNRIWLQCGGEAAIESSGDFDANRGLIVFGNLIESIYYETPIKINQTINSQFLGNSFYDAVDSQTFSNVTNSSPVVFTCPTNVPSGIHVTIRGGTENWAAINGTFLATKASGTNRFSIPVDSTGFGAVTGNIYWVITRSNYYVVDLGSYGNTFHAAESIANMLMVDGPGASLNTVLDSRPGKATSFPKLKINDTDIAIGDVNTDLVRFRIQNKTSPTQAAILSLVQIGYAEHYMAVDGATVLFGTNPASTAIADLRAAANLALSPYTVSSKRAFDAPTSQLTHAYNAATDVLPAAAAGTKGMRALVSDATVATPGSPYVGGGTYTIGVQCIYNSSGATYSWIID